ncbi:hypothetical protein ACHAWF_008603 [Thalassiosira exigua]
MKPWSVVAGASLVKTHGFPDGGAVHTATATINDWPCESGANKKIIAFATRTRNRCKHHGIKNTRTIEHQSRIAPSQYFSADSGSLSYGRVSMLPEYYENLSTAPVTAFLPGADFVYDLASFVFILSFMFAASSFLVSSPKMEPGEATAINMGEGGRERKNAGDDLLTPETYADSRLAKLQVKDTIIHTASDAFQSTDFTHEPHLSPELEDAEVAYEVALLANAAHGLADAADKENRQSKAAMFERERELEWIEKQDEDDSAIRVLKAEAFQRSLLAARLANTNSNDGAKKLEGFQRSLLAARIANNAKANSPYTDQQVKEGWMGSEARAASMGGPECLPFDVASAAASSAAAHALAEAEVEEKSNKKNEGNDAPAIAVSKVAETASRMILGEDIALVEHSTPETPVSESQKQIYPEKNKNDAISEVDQWRKDYVDDITNYVQAKGVEQTKEKLRLTDEGENTIGSSSLNVDSVGTVDTSSTAEIAKKECNSENDSTLKRILNLRFIRKVRERQRLLIVALAVVICRRLILAYFGNGLRLL